MGSPFAHPIHQDMLVEDNAEALRAALNETEEWLRPIWSPRRKIRERLAELEQYELPARRYQTPTQQRVQSCPRCGGHGVGA